MEADGDRIRRDPEDRRDLLMPELLPRRQAQDLLVGRSEQAKAREAGPSRSSPRRIGVATSSTRSRAVEPLTPAEAAALIGQHPPRDRVQPRQGVGRDGVEFAPGDRERLGGDILRVGHRPRASHGVGEDVPPMVA